MKILFLRHTRVEDPATCYGMSEMPLAASFQNDMASVMPLLQPFKIDRMISSPLGRCKQLARFISERSDLPFETDKRLCELDFGEWEGLKWDEIDRKQLKLWSSDYCNTAPPGGETYLQLQQRADECLKSLSGGEDETVLVVTHGGVIRAALALAIDLSLEKAFNLVVDYGSISMVERLRRHQKVHFVNRIAL